MSLSLIHAQIVIASISAVVTVEYFKVTPADPTLNWIALEFKPALAVGWLILAVLSACTIVHGFSGGAPRRSNLGVGTPENMANPPPATTFPENVVPIAAAILRVGVMLDGALASFVLFRRAWPQTSDTLDGVAALALYFNHGFVNCLAICAVGFGVYYLAVGGASALSDSDAMTVDLEKGAEKN